MAANYKTVQKVYRILLDEIGGPKARRIFQRLLDETVPSGNSSYDETIRRLHAAFTYRDRS